MGRMLKSAIRKFLITLGYDVQPVIENVRQEDLEIIQKVRHFTMTGSARLAALTNAVRYIVQNRINGHIVECGVWREGSMMAAAYALISAGDTTRDLYLFDTFSGMTPPTAKDRIFSGDSANDILARTPRREGPGIWAIAGLEDVKANLYSTGYPRERIHFVEGRVEHTIPTSSLSQLALLRLDTDWYESTKHEMIHLYPKVVSRGIVIVDDYGHWRGAREAVDEFFTSQEFRPLLQRVDYTARLIVKP